MHPNDAFIAYQRSGEFKEIVELTAAVDPWENEIDEMDARLGFKEPNAKPTADDRANLIALAAKGVDELFLFCFSGLNLEDETDMRTAIRRFVSVVFKVSPKTLRQKVVAKDKRGKILKVDGPPLSLGQLAAQPQVRTNAKQLHRMATEFMVRWQAT